jgi:hypothetical protein
MRSSGSGVGLQFNDKMDVYEIRIFKQSDIRRQKTIGMKSISVEVDTFRFDLRLGTRLI